MTTDGTQVDVEELRRYGENADERAAGTLAAKETVNDVHLGTDTFGAFATFFVHDVEARRQDLAAKLGEMGQTLQADHTNAIQIADSIASNEAQQAAQFTRPDMP